MPATMKLRALQRRLLTFRLMLDSSEDAVRSQVCAELLPRAVFSPLETRADCSTELNPDGTKKRKKRNRWGDATDNKAAGLMNLPTAVLGNMTSEQLDAYTLHLRIEEISQKLRINDVVPADGDRCVY